MPFFFNDTATTEIYTLSLHDALPICPRVQPPSFFSPMLRALYLGEDALVLAGLLSHVLDELQPLEDRKSTRLNSSHANISYAVFCLKKKNTEKIVVRLNDVHLADTTP